MPFSPDELILLEIDYNVSLIWCKAPHPTEAGIICRREPGHHDDDPSHDLHAIRDGAKLQAWPVVPVADADLRPHPDRRVGIGTIKMSDSNFSATLEAMKDSLGIKKPTEVGPN